MVADSFGWAHDASIALHHIGPNNAYTNLSASSDTWTISALHRPFPTQVCVVQHGQVTPLENNSPPEPSSGSLVLQDSVRPTQPPDDPSLPLAHQLQVLQTFPPSRQTQLRQQIPPARAPKRHRAVKKAPANHSHPGQSGHTITADPQPPKRKRGRPTSRPQPQSLDARQVHLEKNRAAAHKCRQHKKNYVDDLEARGLEAARKNKALKEKVALLREEVLQRKYEVLRHAECNFWVVDEYLARCAGDLLGMNGPLLNHHQYQNPTSSFSGKTSQIDGKEAREMRTESLASQNTADSADGLDIFFGNLDEDIDDDA
jgi:hypothetical protein